MKDDRYDMRYGNDGCGWIDRTGRYHEEIDNEEQDGAAERLRMGKGCPPEEQTHVHEFLGSTKLAEEEEERHNHRFAGISGEAVMIPGGHVHKIMTRTDFFDHFHMICKFTGPAIPVDEDIDDDKHCSKDEIAEHHVHYLETFTTVNDNHRHLLEFATLIDSPLLPMDDEDIV